jgi:hypothetical protein
LLQSRAHSTSDASLVPASSFCEPNCDVKPATWHWFALAGREPHPIFAFPGIWRRYIGPVRKGGDPVNIETFAFLTTGVVELCYSNLSRKGQRWNYRTEGRINLNRPELEGTEIPVFVMEDVAQQSVMRRRPAGRDDQSRAHAGHTHASGGIHAWLLGSLKVAFSLAGQYSPEHWETGSTRGRLARGLGQVRYVAAAAATAKVLAQRDRGQSAPKRSM